MKGRLPRALLLATFVVLLPYLSGPSSTTAEGNRQDGSVIQCLAESSSALLVLEFPAGGGPVRGEYSSSVVTEEVSSLFDEDGSSEVYREERAVDVSMALTGAYSPDASPALSLQLGGVGTAYIDNLEDDRFDRSYEAVLAGTATGLFNDDGSLSVTGIAMEFTPQQKQASEIPNTVWLDPSAAVMPTEMTLSCQPMAAAAAPVTECTISTIPDPIGPQDTIIQAKVTATGFRAPSTPSLGVIGPYADKFTLVADWNATLTWSGASLSPGFYTIRSWVSEGYPGPHYAAECATHFTIGDVPNSPPECQITGLNPPVPSVGDTSLEVSVQGQDADGDPLNYSFNLQGSMANSGVNVGPSHTFSILGGLQPRGYSVMVTVKDGKHENYCQRNILVSGAPLPPGAPATTIPPGPPIKRSPPMPPSPPGPTPLPPAPPPAPPPTQGCGPVQVIYLDDLGVGLNQAEIDAFIESTLAQGGPDLSLVISHRQSLLDRFGQPGFDQIDALLRDLGNVAETCPFLLIVGDHDVVPFAVVPNPTTDGDVLFTDDVYGDNDQDVLGMPDIPVARIPDGWSLNLLLTQLSASDVPEAGDFTLANSKRPHAEGVARQVFGADRILLWSLPTRHGEVDISRTKARYSYFMLHGGAWDTSVWWGEEDAYPAALTVQEARSGGVVLSGACYGSYTLGRTPANSITLSFLESGARAFVGSTGITYSPLWTTTPSPTGPMRHDALFHQAFLSSVTGGNAPLAAFMEAKGKLAELCRGADATDAELKMLHEFIYFGKP